MTQKMKYHLTTLIQMIRDNQQHLAASAANGKVRYLGILALTFLPRNT